MAYETIFLIIIVAILTGLFLIYESKNEILKRITTILIIAIICWSITKDNPTGTIIGVLLFIIVTGIFIYICKKVDDEKLEKEKILETEDFDSYLKTLES